MRGTVVGWGKDENRKPFTNTPRKVSATIVSSDTCSQTDPIYKRLTSFRTFCAGNRDNSGPCTGDSGSGLVLNIEGRWFLRGIVSSGFNDQTTDTCDLRHYSIYTDVAKFQIWIERTMLL